MELSDISVNDIRFGFIATQQQIASIPAKYQKFVTECQKIEVEVPNAITVSILARHLKTSEYEAFEFITYGYEQGFIVPFYPAHSNRH